MHTNRFWIANEKNGIHICSLHTKPSPPHHFCRYMVLAPHAGIESVTSKSYRSQDCFPKLIYWVANHRNEQSLVDRIIVLIVGCIAFGLSQLLCPDHDSLTAWDDYAKTGEEGHWENQGQSALHGRDRSEPPSPPKSMWSPPWECDVSIAFPQGADGGLDAETLFGEIQTYGCLTDTFFGKFPWTKIYTHVKGCFNECICLYLNLSLHLSTYIHDAYKVIHAFKKGEM